MARAVVGASAGGADARRSTDAASALNAHERCESISLARPGDADQAAWAVVMLSHVSRDERLHERSTPLCSFAPKCAAPATLPSYAGLPVGTTLRQQLQTSLGTRYTIERELVGGGMSHVFVATESRLGRRVVIKVLASEVAQELSAERFERELRVAASLQQANIVPVLTAGDLDGLTYYTMPFVEGESLRIRLTAGPVPTIAEIVAIARDVGRALAYAHARGVIHRDIKPDNVLLSGGTAVVTDFGIAKAITASLANDVQATLSQRGAFLGTPAYMAPEQAAGDPGLDHRADLYAFGCMLYELLAGRPPFVRRSTMHTLAAHLNDTATPVAERRPDCPPALARIVMRLLAKSPADRPPCVEDVLRALEAIPSGNVAAVPEGARFGGVGTLGLTLALYAVSATGVALVARTAVLGIGLPEWVFPSVVALLLLGLPALLATAYVLRVMRRGAAGAPTFTSPNGTGTIASLVSTLTRIALRAGPHVSWQRTWRAGGFALVAFAVLVAAYMLLRALGIGPAGSLFASGALARDDRLLMADFTVTREDSALGPILSEAMRVAMSQSRAVRLVPPADVASALQQMRRLKGTLVEGDLAREVAQRVGATAVVGGRAARVGTAYALSVELTSAQGGAPLASYQATADGARELIPTIDGLTRKLRGRMGESLKQVRRTVPLEQATTTSLEALRKYSEAVYTNDVKNDFDQAVRLLREAVALDSTFALAWRKLASALGNGGYSEVARDSALERAAHLADRLPDREKYLVLGTYYSVHTTASDKGKAFAAYRAAYAADTMNADVAGRLWRQFASRRQFDSATWYARRQFVLQPSAGATATLAMALAYVGDRAGSVRLLDSLERADSTVRRTQLFLETRISTLWGVGTMDSARMAAEALHRINAGVGRMNGAAWLAADAATRGQVVRSRHFLGDHFTIKAALGNPGISEVSGVWRAAEDILLSGRPAEGVRRLDSIAATPGFAALPPESRFTWLMTARHYARAGEPRRAEAMLARVEREWPEGLSSSREFRAMLRAEIALARGDVPGAVSLFRLADRGTDGTPSYCDACTFHGLARAFDLGGQHDSAATYYERYLAVPASRRWNYDVDDIGAYADTHRRLGQLYDARHDRARAVTHYRAFVDLWRDADPELQPRVAGVRKRLAELARG